MGTVAGRPVATNGAGGHGRGTTTTPRTAVAGRDRTRASSLSRVSESTPLPAPSDPDPSLPLPGREAVLEHARGLILAAWESFDRARPQQPLPGDRHHELLGRPLPRAGSDPVQALDSAVEILDVSLAQARPRFFAYIGSSGLEIGVLGDALMASHDVNVAVSAGAADLLEAQTVRWVGEFTGFSPRSHRTARRRRHDLQSHRSDRRPRARRARGAPAGHRRAADGALLLR